MLSYEVLLPSYNKQAYKQYESNQEMQANDEAFTSAVLRLMQQLSNWLRECNLQPSA